MEDAEETKTASQVRKCVSLPVAGKMFATWRKKRATVWHISRIISTTRKPNPVRALSMGDVVETPTISTRWIHATESVFRESAPTRTSGVAVVNVWMSGVAVTGCLTVPIGRMRIAQCVHLSQLVPRVTSAVLTARAWPAGGVMVDRTVPTTQMNISVLSRIPLPMLM